MFSISVILWGWINFGLMESKQKRGIFDGAIFCSRKHLGVENETFLFIKENLKILKKMINYSSRNYKNNSLDCPIAYQWLENISVLSVDGSSISISNGQKLLVHFSGITVVIRFRSTANWVSRSMTDRQTESSGVEKGTTTTVSSW